jgi:hypothetical protein
MLHGQNAKLRIDILVDAIELMEISTADLLEEYRHREAMYRNAYYREEAERPRPSPFLNQSHDEARTPADAKTATMDAEELSLRAYSCTKQCNIVTVYDLCQHTRDSLHVPKIGAKSIDELESIARSYQLSLGMTKRDIDILIQRSERQKSNDATRKKQEVIREERLRNEMQA